MKSNKSRSGLATIFTIAGVAVAGFLAAGYSLLNNESEARAGVMALPLLDPPPPIVVQPTLPPDIPGGAGAADLIEAATFAWQEFIALNWPAMPDMRDMPDANRLFGDQSSPLVWHTYRAKVEIYPGNGSAMTGPHGYMNNPPDYGYDAPPDYIYDPAHVNTPDGRILPAFGQPPTQPAWINLDEISQIGIDNMYAGVVQSPSDPHNSVPPLIRYMAKANRTEYRYVAANQFWYNSPQLCQASTNLKNAINGNTPPMMPYVDFPAGTVEVKAAWRQLATTENPLRFHTTRVRYYENQPAPGGLGTMPVYREAIWALIALHIIHKTPTAPYFIYATFEQADNIQVLQENTYVPVEDEDGNIINPSHTPYSTSPGLMYHDAPDSAGGPLVSLNPCDAPCNDDLSTGGRLYYKNNPMGTGLPHPDPISVNRRNRDIPPAVISVNAAAHAAINAYNQQHGVLNSPWMYYKLVNVQWRPFDKSTIDPTDPNGNNNPATYYQANIVVETNYTLQNFSGRVDDNFAPTDYASMMGNPPYSPAFKNVHVFNPPPTQAYNMGGCMGCHGNAQREGYDFSFILEGSSVLHPETPTPGLLLKQYMRQFPLRLSQR